ncbi:MAG: thioredoxin-dependent thiol peroxidase [Candidatus Moranbacteria bacterium]|nr:thioredoxin-dependent thiol peroxidase [Candidatus Moranbacteria bacterium]
MKLVIGDKIPNFRAVDERGKEYSQDTFSGSWLLLYFYPKDDTPGCTKEACSFRDIWSQLQERNVFVLGVSTQNARSHQKFIEKYSLPFPLLVDEEKNLATLFGVWGEKTFLGKKYKGMKRVSFLINPEGKIVKIYEVTQTEKHAENVLQDIEKFLIQKK